MSRHTYQGMRHQDFIRTVRPDVRAQKRKYYSDIPSRLLYPREYERKVYFWVYVLTEYSWHRCSLSLSEYEISNCFHLNEKDVRSIVRHMLKAKLLQRHGSRLVFTDNVKRLDSSVRDEWHGGSYLTLEDLQYMTFYRFVDGKKYNQEIICYTPGFYLELRYKNNAIYGAKVRGF